MPCASAGLKVGLCWNPSSLAAAIKCGCMLLPLSVVAPAEPISTHRCHLHMWCEPACGVSLMCDRCHLHVV